MVSHRDRECNSALIRLLDALCTWERNTGRKSTLILIPHSVDEGIIQAQDGKPVPVSTVNSPYRMLQLALMERGKRK